MEKPSSEELPAENQLSTVPDHEKSHAQLILELDQLRRTIALSESLKSERKRAEDELLRYKYIVSSSTDMLALLNTNFTYLAANDAYVRAFDLTIEDIIGQTVSKVFGEKIFQKVIKPNADRCMAGEAVNYQDWFNFPAYEPRYMDINYYPYLNKDGVIKGFAVSGRDITKRKQAEEELKQLTYDLSERVKELNCLYSISTLIDQIGISLEEILQGTVDLIPPSWQYPNITRARLIIDGTAYTSDDFAESQWNQTCPIISDGEEVGNVEVFYLDERPKSDEGPFLSEEWKLISAVAATIGTIVEKKYAEDALFKANEELEQQMKMRTDNLVRTNGMPIQGIEERKKTNE